MKFAEAPVKIILSYAGKVHLLNVAAFGATRRMQ